MKRKKAFRTKEERDAWNAHVAETLARLRTLAEGAQAAVDAKKRAESAAEPGA